MHGIEMGGRRLESFILGGDTLAIMSHDKANVPDTRHPKL
jgi:hypothetical protein